MSLDLLLTGAFFCYGMFTLQRPGFLLDFMRKIWKKFPEKLHEPLFSCGVCVSSFWGIVFLVLNYYGIYPIIYLIAFCGVCATLDRAVKFWEYGYKYNPVPAISNYSYLENAGFRDIMIEKFVDDATDKELLLIEIGGHTVFYEKMGIAYRSFDKPKRDLLNNYVSDTYFVIIKGIAFDGNFDILLNLLGAPNCKGFVVEGSTSGISGTQINWIKDRFKDQIIQMPYKASLSGECPEHCGSNVNERIVIVKPVI